MCAIQYYSIELIIRLRYDYKYVYRWYIYILYSDVYMCAILYVSYTIYIVLTRTDYMHMYRQYICYL